jgi:hypothetical protein
VVELFHALESVYSLTVCLVEILLTKILVCLHAQILIKIIVFSASIQFIPLHGVILNFTLYILDSTFYSLFEVTHFGITVILRVIFKHLYFAFAP